MSLRSQRLAKTLDPQASAFLDSTREDRELAIDDVLGSLAHLRLLEDAKILNAKEADKLQAALARLYKEALAGDLKLEAQLEDVHMNVESRLIHDLGDLGKKLHTGRSRNDQVALDLRLFSRRWTLGTGKALHDLIQALLRLADKYKTAILPGYTHLQVAQPVLLRFQLLAHAERFTRDLERLRDAYQRLNVSPLGAGALAGTRHAIRPHIAAQALAFDRTFRNAMDAVSDRDYVAELLFAASLAMVHASGLAEELILFTTQEYGFASIGDDFATGSSIMPQKKNPDIFEVTRGKSGASLGALVASLAALKGLPMAYNRDLQDQKRLFVEAFPTFAQNLSVVARTLKSVTFHPARMKKAAESGYGDATDLADYLVQRGVPFRDAHAQTARLVRLAIQKGVPLLEIALPEFQKVNKKIGPDVKKYLGAAASVAGKKSPGGTGATMTNESAAMLRSEIKDVWSFFEVQFARVHAATQELLSKTAEKSK